MNTLSTYWKAVVGFLAPGAVLLGSAVLDSSDGGSSITQTEIVTALVAMVVTSAGVARVTNTPTPAVEDEGHEEPLEAKHLDTPLDFHGEHEAGA